MQKFTFLKSKSYDEASDEGYRLIYEYQEQIKLLDQCEAGVNDCLIFLEELYADSPTKKTKETRDKCWEKVRTTTTNCRKARKILLEQITAILNITNEIKESENDSKESNENEKSENH